MTYYQNDRNEKNNKAYWTCYVGQHIYYKDYGWQDKQKKRKRSTEKQKLYIILRTSHDLKLKTLIYLLILSYQ